MRKELVKELMETGREIEFEFKGKQYSLCPYLEKPNEKWISFCEFYQNTLDVKDVDILWGKTYNGQKVSDILESVPENEIDIY